MVRCGWLAGWLAVMVILLGPAPGLPVAATARLPSAAASSPLSPARPPPLPAGTTDKLELKWTMPNKWTATAYSYSIRNTADGREVATGALTYSGDSNAEQVAATDTITEVATRPWLYQVGAGRAPALCIASRPAGCSSCCRAARLGLPGPPWLRPTGRLPLWLPAPHLLQVAITASNGNTGSGRTNSPFPADGALLGLPAPISGSLTVADTTDLAGKRQLSVSWSDPNNPWSASGLTTVTVNVWTTGTNQATSPQIINPFTDPGCNPVAKTCTLVTAKNGGLPGEGRTSVQRGLGARGAVHCQGGGAQRACEQGQGQLADAPPRHPHVHPQRASATLLS